jgi:hypothetical protein
MNWELVLKACGWGLLMALVGANTLLDKYIPDAAPVIKFGINMAAVFGTGVVAYLAPPAKNGNGGSK